MRLDVVLGVHLMLVMVLVPTLVLVVVSGQAGVLQDPGVCHQSCFRR